MFRTGNEIYQIIGSLTGFDVKQIDDLLASCSLGAGHEDQVPDIPEVPVSRSGDLWLCGRHRVLCGDATSSEAVAHVLGDSKPVVMVTDPPTVLNSTLNGVTGLG